MFKVNSTETARKAYTAIAMFDEMMKEHPTDGHAVADLVLEIKRDLREWTHRVPGDTDVGFGFIVNTRPVKDYGIDGYIALVSIPTEFTTEKDADEFFRDFLYMECRPSMYDCTGQAFTSWYKLFKRRGQFYAYHSIAFDV